MAETYSIKKKSNSLNELNTSYESQKSMNKKERKNSINSSSPDTSFNNLNTEIKSIIENETDLSFSSNSNSEINENKKNIELLLDSKFWRASKEINSETDEPISTYESQNEKNTPSKKDNYIIVDKQNSPKPFHSKYAEVQEMVGTSVGSNKQSTQSNEDEEARHEHLHNISYCESNNNSPINSLENNESEENEIKKEKMKINIEDGKNNINLKEKVNNNINNNLNNNNKLFINGFNNYNNLQNLKYNNDSEFSYPYDPINYKNNNIPFFPGVYLPQQLCPFIPNYNYSAINKKNFLINNNNINNKLEDINSSEKNEDLAPSLENNYNIQNNQYIHSYMNNLNNMNNRKVDMIDLPLLLNQNNPQNNTINYGYSKINFICCPQIQPVNAPIQKTVVEKINNSSNYLPEINNKENTSNSNKANSKNASNNINSSNNTNICPVIEQNNNKIKINNKNFIINKNINILNNKVSIKGEKQVLNLDDIVSGKDTRTTVMIRNIPIKYTDEILIEALKEFNGKYDCLYMPYDYEKNGNKGYAFINFVHPLHILYFYDKFCGKKWQYFDSSKICELNSANFQGINEIQKHSKNYKGLKKPLFCQEPNKGNISGKENIIIPMKYLNKLKLRYPKLKYKENKAKKYVVVESFE